MIQINSPSGREIAVFIDTSTEYGRGLLDGIIRFTRDQAPHWRVFLEAGSGEDPRTLTRWSGDGLLARPRSLEARQHIAAMRVPRVIMFPMADVAIDPAAPCVEAVKPDRERDTALAVEHLVANGLKDLTFVPAFNQRVVGRAEPAMLAARAHDIELGHYALPDAPRPTAREQIEHLAGFLKTLPKPHGIIAANDWAGRDVIDAARLAGIRIPDELAVIGSDNDSTFCNFCSPTLSSIAIDTPAIGYHSAQTLEHLMDGGPPPEAPTLLRPVGVIARQSTDALYIEDPRLRVALNFIRESATSRIGVQDIAAAAAMSRRALETLFKKVVGTTPAKAIEQARVRHAMRLLGSTSWKMDRIADACGYANAPRLYESFKRTTGINPRAFRDRTRQLTNPEDAASLVDLPGTDHDQHR